MMISAFLYRFVILSILFVLTARPATLLRAEEGKVFFSNGRSLQGEIREQADTSGKPVVVIALNSGSVTVPQSQVEKIVYDNGPNRSRLVSESEFYQALRNTDRERSVDRFPSPYGAVIAKASAKNQLDPDLIKAVIRQESNFNRLGISRKGARGLMQLMPQTAREMGVQDLFDPWQNIHGGARYLRLMLESFDGDLRKALAAYNAGPAAVRKYGRIPPYKETQGYVRSVLKYYRMYRQGHLFSYRDRNGQLVITDRPYYPIKNR